MKPKLTTAQRLAELLADAAIEGVEADGSNSITSLTLHMKRPNGDKFSLEINTPDDCRELIFTHGKPVVRTVIEWEAL